MYGGGQICMLGNHKCSNHDVLLLDSDWSICDILFIFMSLPMSRATSVIPQKLSSV